MELFMIVFFMFYFVCTITPIFGQALILTVLIRSKLLRDSDNSYLLVGMLIGEFLICCATLWQFAMAFIDPFTVDPFFMKGQCLLMEAPNIAGMVISQIITLSLAIDRMNSLRNQMAYYQKNHLKSSMYWWGAAGLLGIATAAMPQIANDIGTVIHCTDPTWPTWFRRYWMGFSIIVSTAVLLAYLLVIVFSRKKNGISGKNEDSRANERRIVREKLITKTVMRVLAVYVLFWGLPSLVYNVTVIFNVSLGSSFGMFMMLGSVLCSSGNIILLLMREDIRAGAKSLFGCKQKGPYMKNSVSAQKGSVNTIRVIPHVD
uniref:G-protein coupled receptors family 1 profile domain-containing protein n=1 Tax=Plectus sambesii TaxID=2011161 RepID=A0A914VNW3_9BILA